MGKFKSVVSNIFLKPLLLIPLTLLLVFIAQFTSLKVEASPESLILITELQTGQGSSEFLEVENVSNSELDLSQWVLRYHGATSTNWTTKTLSFYNPAETTISSGERALITSSGYSGPGVDPIASFTSGLADTGGVIQIYPTSVPGESSAEEPPEGGVTVPAPPTQADLEALGDKLSWGTTDPPACSIAPKHTDGQSLKRFPSGDGAIVDTGSSGKDFYVSSSPSPDSIDNQDPFSIDEVKNYCGMPEEITEDPQAPGAPENPGSPPPPIYLRVDITELFVDPVAPQADTEDEYIELFNPNPESINLIGYKLQTGINSTYSYTFGDLVLQSGEYYALSRKDSGLTLSNSSSKARLLDPNGDIVFETEPYDKAYQAQSWQLYGGVWQWSSSPTPSAANIQLGSGGAATSLAAKTTKLPSKTASKAKKAKKATAKKPKAKKASVTKKPKATKKDKKSNAFSYTDDNGTTKIQPYILWGGGALILLYALWEYRLDLLNFLKKSNKRVG